MCSDAPAPLTKPASYPRAPNRRYTQIIPSTKGPLTGGDHQMGAGMQVARMATQPCVNSDALPSRLGESPRCP